MVIATAQILVVMPRLLICMRTVTAMMRSQGGLGTQTGPGAHKAVSRTLRTVLSPAAAVRVAMAKV